MTNNIGGGPLLNTYDKMLHNMLLPSTYNGNVVGITSVKLTSVMHMLEWGRKGSQQRLEAVQDRVDRKLYNWCKQVHGRSSSMRRPRVEETRGKEGREEGALWKVGGEA